MYSFLRTLILTVCGLALLTIIVVCFHLGGSFALHIGQFAPLSGAFVGGTLVLISATLPGYAFAEEEGWQGYEQLSWLLIGIGIIAWGIGDSIWRHYISIGQSPFPSLADIGYVTFPLLVFSGLLIQPSSGLKRRRFVLAMDCLIAMGSILAIAWDLLLGSLAQAPTETSLAKILGLYYPISDTALLSCIIFLLLRMQDRGSLSRARRYSLLVIGIGLCFFVTSDFIFNIQQNANTYVEATWIDLGWPLGMITIGIAAFLRRFPFTVPERLQAGVEDRSAVFPLNPLQFLPYVLVVGLLAVLADNVLSADHGQQAIRPILLIATLSVVVLVIIRQVFTLQENTHLLKNQRDAFQRLQQVNKQIEVQAQQIAQQNTELERGIEHLKEVHASLANGNYRARATLTRGVLWPLAASLNLMAERWARVGQELHYTQRLRKALDQLSGIVERKAPILFSDLYNDFPEINRLMTALSQQDEAAEQTLSQKTHPHLPRVSSQQTGGHSFLSQQADRHRLPPHADIPRSARRPSTQE